MHRRRVPALKSALAPLALLAILVISISGLALAGTATPAAPDAQHDIYNPARTALVNAQRQLAESSRQEKDILEAIERMRGELDASLALLSQAEQLDPSMQEPIAQLRARLAALQDRPSLCPEDSTSSLGVYSRLLDEMQGLIDHY